MEIAIEVLMDTGRILALVLVGFALCISTMILFKPHWASALNRKFNTLYSNEKTVDKLNQRVSTTEVVLKNRLLVGSLFFAGSAFVFWYSLAAFDPQKFIDYVIQPGTRSGIIFSEIVMESLQWLFVIVSLIGVLTAITILFRPNTFKAFSDKLDHLFSTDDTVKHLEELHSSLDSWVIRHHVLVGGLMFAGSVFLTVVCINEFLG